VVEDSERETTHTLYNTISQHGSTTLAGKQQPKYQPICLSFLNNDICAFRLDGTITKFCYCNINCNKNVKNNTRNNCPLSSCHERSYVTVKAKWKYIFQ